MELRSGGSWGRPHHRKAVFLLHLLREPRDQILVLTDTVVQTKMTSEANVSSPTPARYALYPVF